MQDQQQNDIVMESVEEEGKSFNWRSMLYEIFETAVIALVMVFVINAVSARIRVDGSSMEPNFHDGNYVVVSRLAYRFGEIERGDVVVFEFPSENGEDYIKRVIGLPGDHVEIKGGYLYVNDMQLDEPYIMETPRRDYDVYVPSDMVVVMGDNRNDSTDSRAWGPMAIPDIVGKAVFVYWPFTDFGGVTHYDLDLIGP